jgi:hypothetical protein
MKNDVVSKTGLVQKRPAKMSMEELRQWKKDSYERAKAYLFSIGQPLVHYNADGKAVAEYEDGTVMPVQ